MLVNIPAAVGELFDKITILRIKAERLTDPGKRANVAEELGLLEVVAERVAQSQELNRLIADLQAVNAGLWEVEDAKRAHERLRRFDEAFIQLARRVYLENDRRAAIKREINLLTGSAVVEEKSYG
ncbi:DUF6165 family protein [Brevundimonas sp. Root1423]|uniref:DUF6165 family protein n=1 Tax=Brevundimonas sp. Root1423 TaxID=1736462 RepID=UPI0006F3A63C|nr:DUF6165 family protein [Brevundimonas sp. Root1423]KQY84984.1 hypothetical protein ASD25_08255 [Brevundimonas sp. Root1423]